MAPARKIPRVNLAANERRALEQIFRDRLDAITQAEFEAHKATLRAAIIRRVEADWGAPEKQADMLVMQKYRHAAPVRWGNMNVYDPQTKRWDQRFGIDVQSDILMPNRDIPYAGQEPRSTYECHVGKDDIDYAGIFAIATWRRDRQAQVEAEKKAFHAAIRATASYAKIVEQFPWLDTDEFRPYFAKPQYIETIREVVS